MFHFILFNSITKLELDKELLDIEKKLSPKIVFKITLILVSKIEIRFIFVNSINHINLNFKNMKKTVLIYFCVLLSAVLTFSCKPKDQDLQKTVETALSTTTKNIQSTVKDGVVTLTGIVDSQEAKDAIEATAKGIKDIKSVVNNIEVQTPAPTIVVNADDTLKSLIATGLTAGGFNDVSVDVKDGNVTLTGNVKRADLTKVMQIANEAKPKKVINELKIN